MSAEALQYVSLVQAPSTLCEKTARIHLHTDGNDHREDKAFRRFDSLVVHDLP